jgi:signal transduction histidine kinase
MKGEILFQQRHVLVMSVIGLVLAMEVAIFTAYTLARPLHQLAKACERIAKRKWQLLPLAPGAPREILLLQKAFNTMVEELQHWQQVQHQVFRMERLAALGQMVAGVSHEIRNPLAGMRVHLDLLRESSSCEENTSLQILDTELDRLNTLVAQLLTFARPGESVHGPVLLEELCIWCSNILSVQLEKKNLRLLRKISPRALRVLGSMPQLQQLLLNLVLNALQASPPEGIIALGGSVEGDTCILSVKDQGPGIPDHIAPRLFDPFVSGHPEGTGLGLSIAARIVDLHGGAISWESSPKGTYFRVVLPLYREESPHEKEALS